MICLAVFALGFFIALMGNYNDYENAFDNFIYQSYLGASSGVKIGVYLFIYIAVIYLLILISGFNFYVFCAAGYGGILILSLILWRYPFIAVAVSAFHGLLYLLLFFLPLALIDLWVFSFSLLKLYRICGFNACRRGFGRYDYKTIFKATFKNALFLAGVNLGWYIVLALIFGAIY